MSNTLKMVQINTIRTLLEQGWSQRRIARELGINRETVGRYARIFEDEKSKPAKVTAGNEAPGDSKPAKVTAGSVHSRSSCEPLREEILEKLNQQLSAQRIYQDITEEFDFTGSYESVKRFVRKLGTESPFPFRRIESPAGEEAQVDFGKAGFVKTDGKRKRRPHLFRIVLSHSRKGYSEAVWSQDLETFIRCIENAFFHFGGVPKTLVVDNLRAAVSKADWYDPDINPKFASFARHWGFAVLPTKPYTPRHKGKIESGVNYSQENASKARVFESIEEQNAFLLQWETGVADQRIHGTTRQQVRKLFEEERRALLPLAPARFPYFKEAERKVHRDGHVAVENSFYSVPPEYLGQTVWIRWDSRLVKIFDKHLKQIAVHARAAPGRFSTHAGHIAPEKIAPIERGLEYYLEQGRRVGPESARWCEELARRRGIYAIRVLQGFLSLTRNYPWRELERAARVALSHGAFRLKTIRRLLKTPESEEQMDLLSTHPLIREMAEYGQFVRAGSREETQTETDSGDSNE